MHKFVVYYMVSMWKKGCFEIEAVSQAHAEREASLRVENSHVADLYNEATRCEDGEAKVMEVVPMGEKNG